ncbi:MAG: glutaminyl-peptide cyclotransferase [Acidobacteriota bacterium]|nr:MAG: glutaminyl-peptide cyclotransferase [Acidobacteriota bacterium]
MKSETSILIILALSLLTACRAGTAAGEFDSGQNAVQAPLRVFEYGYEIVNSYPHDTNAFTQGLVYHEGRLYESTGLNGRSSIREVELETGRVIRKLDVPSQYFGEGLTIFDGRAFQLTWLSQFGYVYDLPTFNIERTFNYPGEGWGLTHDGRSLIMSDGSNRIRFLEPSSFDLERAISVYDGSTPLNYLNELEYVDGEIYANIWQSNRIVIIEPGGGRITGWIDMHGLLRPEDRTGPVDVLNGIAYDAARKRLFVTGKLWPKVYEIRLTRRRGDLRRSGAN